MSDTEKKKCTACAMLIPKDAQMCPYCKTIQPLPEKSSFGCSTIISGIVIVSFLFRHIFNVWEFRKFCKPVEFPRIPAQE